MAKYDRDDALRRDTLAQEAEVARQRNEQGMLGLQAQLEGIKGQTASAAAERELAQRQWDEKSKQAAEMLARTERQQREAAAVAQYGPGAAQIMAGQYGTPEAQQALEQIASTSDQSVTGFYNSDASRFDAELERLGVTDPEMRKQLVTQYGLSVTFGPSSRSGPISGLVNWMSGPYR